LYDKNLKHIKEKRKEKIEWRDELKVREVQGEGPRGQENL
jgi:hypothetical protein